MEIDIEKFLVKEGDKLNIKKIGTEASDKFQDKESNKKELSKIVEQIDELQNILYAENKQSLLVIFQGIDAAGKDSSIRAIMTGVNPQGVEVSAFKTPSSLEYEHDYLWRHILKLPEKGKIGIFNRSHYENVLVCKVHPEFILNENLPSVSSVEDINDEFFATRYKEIKNFEKYMCNNGTKVIKFFLNISKEEQKKRFIKRIENKEKNWKFSSSDLKERKFWDKYQEAFTSALENTSTSQSPWYVIPCDNKSYGQLIMATVIKETLQKMNPKFPKVNPSEEEALKNAYQELLNEKN
ncbi:polyphosphate kinase 2 family protein [Apibacter raozihei]|uniref:PPK2 family polyphosphate kinase n=1 Tax=Apibacter raozihei TaxID=2500547 RepID=UPI000FE3018A|nr:PPK2 family polyphosphate kinase [Apibacter raozihei]